jgi:ribonuclease BN (tRNA processing enzyme)
MDENEMRLILLGTGTGIPSGDRASPSLVLLMKGGPVLFDMGPGTLRRLASLGIPFDRINQVCFTHFHPDHTADLIHFLFATRHPSVLERRKPFRMIGPRGFQDFIKRVRAAYQHWLDLPPELVEIEELDTGAPEERPFENFRLSTRPVDHTPHSLAYRIESHQGRSFVYSGDTGFCDGIIQLAQDTDLLILECSSPEGQEERGHLTPSLAGRIAGQAGAKRLVLLHFYPEVLGTDIARDCRKEFEGEIILGRDNLHLTV